MISVVAAAAVPKLERVQTYMVARGAQSGLPSPQPQLDLGSGRGVGSGYQAGTRWGGAELYLHTQCAISNYMSSAVQYWSTAVMVLQQYAAQRQQCHSSASLHAILAPLNENYKHARCHVRQGNCCAWQSPRQSSMTARNVVEGVAAAFAASVVKHALPPSRLSTTPRKRGHLVVQL